MTVWIIVLCGLGAALRLVLTEARKPADTVALAALGWPPSMLRAAAWMVGVTVAGSVFAAATAMWSPAVGMHAVIAVGLWLPVLVPWALRRMLLANYRQGRDMALMVWLRRIRLYAAAGRPINDAALEAAERVTSPAFAPVATSINLALASGRDPLAAAEAHFVGSPAETLVSTLISAERSGGAAQDLIDRLIAQAVQALEDRRRTRIEQLGRAVANTSTLVAVAAGLVVIVATLASLPQTGL